MAIADVEAVSVALAQPEGDVSSAMGRARMPEPRVVRPELWTPRPRVARVELWPPHQARLKLWASCGAQPKPVRQAM
jgi:hypothetical protein